MEEILASIRKIISEDATEAAPVAEAKPAPDPVPVPAPEPEADILDLTQEVVEEPVAPPPAPVYEPVVEVAPPEQDVVFEPIDEHHEPAPSPEGIFSDRTRQSIDDAFAAIEEEEEEMPVAAALSPVHTVAPSGSSVEAVFERAVRDAFEPVVKEWLGANAPQVIEKMKPLIREWMDEHFPALLEGAVREEVARVAKARGSKH
jgi:cell pole-organizing protein PopZ